ncbi:MAG: SDR family oxidoreductase [Thaumarchaeota archaeon]|nr:SDR family oxidoreductase [Nitrososphaerota archaeon]
MLRTLDGEVALVTGASRGIGRAVALRLAKQGADLVLTGRTKSDLDEVGELIQKEGKKVLVSPGDATKEEDVAGTFKQVKEKFGKLDILVNNVGIGAYKPFVETSVKEYNEMLSENLESTFLFTKFAVPMMIARHYGQIITISSQSGKAGYSGEAPYVGTKFFQMGMMESLDRELLPHNIKVCVVCPGSVNTFFAIGSGRTKGDPSLNQYLDAEDVAEAVNFVAAQPWKSMIMEIDLRPVTEARY